MSQTQEVPLNGAYYGPSIPPAQQPRPKRSRGCCVLSTFLKVMISIIVVLGIAALIFWLVVRPTEVKVYVVGAELKQFNLTNGNTLNYDLSMNITVRNPNRRIGLYYDQLDAIASYNRERFGWANLPRFYQGHKNTTDLHADFNGQHLMLLNTFEFNQDKNNGYFYIDVKLYSRIRFKIGAIKTRRVKPDIECHLRIPLVSNGTFSMFETTRCDVDF
ncbi:NDR1/HIN1-like protein [Thalictrum thalictroides]|uniref:NDR1/HIN1-like protein n=1 Tax=Thalictrum thalictroides TaxID=46969 RepID=A0A7J6USS7_THATH|nr:NDR1/HIN1-like protein [Thalictrum thalictroides]